MRLCEGLLWPSDQFSRAPMARDHLQISLTPSVATSERKAAGCRGVGFTLSRCEDLDHAGPHDISASPHVGDEGTWSSGINLAEAHAASVLHCRCPFLPSASSHLSFCSCSILRNKFVVVFPCFVSAKDECFRASRGRFRLVIASPCRTSQNRPRPGPRRRGLCQHLRLRGRRRAGPRESGRNKRRTGRERNPGAPSARGRGASNPSSPAEEEGEGERERESERVTESEWGSSSHRGPYAPDQRRGQFKFK